MSMACHICGKHPAQGWTVYRQNAKGQPAIMACEEHNQKRIDPEVTRVTTLIESAQRTKQ